MNRKDCRQIYFDILNELDMWKYADIISVDRTLLIESAECIKFLLKHYKGE